MSEKKEDNKEKYTSEWLIQKFAEADERAEKRAAEFDARLEKSRRDREKSSAEFDARLEESRREADKRSAEADKRQAEADKRSAEADKRAAEADKRAAEADKSMADLKKHLKEIQQKIGGIDESNGLMAEEMIYNSLEKDMTFGGIKFDDIDRNVKLKSKFLNLQGEYDVVLKNGDTIAIIETKYKVRKENIEKILNKQLSDFRILFPMFSNYKILLGVGGMSFDKNAEEEAKKAGVGIIKILGDKIEYYTEGIRMY